jgi:chemotaxis protein MotA
MFLDSHALILVVGGTGAAALIAFPLGRILDLVKMFFFGVIFKTQGENAQIIREIICSAPIAQFNPEFLNTRRSSHPFLREGYLLISEGLLDESQLHDVLRKRSQQFKKIYMADAKMLNALAKFPPAFGLLGATTGMIAMMTKLGSGGQDSIGPAMAIALVATFWGIAVANFILLPLADYATRVALDDLGTRQIITEGLMMLKRRESPMLVAEKLNSYLPVKKRVLLTKSELAAAAEGSKKTAGKNHSRAA